MTDYDILRKRMVEEQLIPRGIKGKRVLDAFYKIPRHKFIPQEVINTAYADFPLPIGNGQTISQPYIVALMTESLEIKGGEKILEVGTGSGYQTAILAELGKEVYSMERFADLSERAKILLDELGYTNVRIKSGDGTLGWQEVGPFDRIIITAATSIVPPPLIEQLKEEGKLILPLGDNFSQTLTLVEKKQDKLEYKGICDCVFVPLVGKYSKTGS